jgi:hypothetical protein
MVLREFESRSRRLSTMNVRSIDVALKVAQEIVTLSTTYSHARPANEYTTRLLSRALVYASHTLGRYWLKQLDDDKLPKDRHLPLYHVCHAEDIGMILEKGIIHDKSPTLTPYLPGAVLRALYYRSRIFRGFDRTEPIVLRIIVPYDQIQYVKCDGMGPGYLPKVTRPLVEIEPDVDIPKELYEKRLQRDDATHAFVLSPDFIDEQIYVPRDLVDIQRVLLYIPDEKMPCL